MQVKGINQFKKEIEEQKGVENKQIDLCALHRNEQTKEIEGLNEHMKK